MLVSVLATAVTSCGGSTTTTTGGSSPSSVSTPSTPAVAPAASNLPAGKYPVQQATFDDTTGEYALMVLNTPAGAPPLFRTTSLRMARVADEAVQDGQKSYLETGADDPVLYLTEDFKIEYVHSVTEAQTDPNTGRQEVVVVRQQSSFWQPFAGAVAGQMVANALFAPRYYVPPVYQPGGVMQGYGGYGNTYNGAVQSYRERYSEPPAVEKNRTRFRQTGAISRPSSSPRSTPRSTGTGSQTSPSPAVRRSPQPGTNRSTGSGFGGNNLRPSNQSSPRSTPTRRKSSFGSSGGSRRPSSSGGGRRRR